MHLLFPVACPWRTHLCNGPRFQSKVGGQWRHVPCSTAALLITRMGLQIIGSGLTPNLPTLHSLGVYRGGLVALATCWVGCIIWMLGLGLSGSSIMHYIIASIVQRGNGLSNLKGDRIDTASLKNLVKILLNHGLTMLSDFHKDWVKVSALQIRPRSCRPSNRKLSSKVVGSFAYQQATGTDRPPLTSQIGPDQRASQPGHVYRSMENSCF